MQQQQLDIHQALVARCRQHDRKAQFDLYQLYNKAMFNTSMRMLNNQMEAEDVLQESFLYAFTKIDQFRAESTFGAWLKRIVINRTLNAIKKRKLDIQELNDEVYQRPEEVENVCREIDPRQLNAAIKELPEGARVVFSLYQLEGYDHEEVAGILNISKSTSKSQFARAKKLLAQKLMTYVE